MENNKFLFLKKILFLKLQIILLILLLTIKYSFQTECEKSTPIKKLDNKCYLTFCTKSQFRNGECIISNSVTKTQWLTNIIDVGIKDFRFINFALTTKNDLLLQTTAYPSTQDNYFFGIKSNGRPYFTLKGKEVSIIRFSCLDSEFRTRYNGKFINLIMEDESNNIKELFMSIGKDENNVEIFDFENNEIIIVPSKEMIEYYIRSKKFSLIHFIDNNNNKNTYLLAFIGKSVEDNDDGLYYALQKYEFFYDSEFDFIEYEKTEYIKKKNLDSKNYKYMLSCYQKVNRLIVCFYYNSNLNYTATLYNSNLNEINNFDFNQPSTEQVLFFKCIH